MPHEHAGNGRLILWAWALVSLVLVGLCILFPNRIDPHAQEGGVIETVAALTLICAGIAAFAGFKGFARLYIPLGCFLLAERELDSDTFDENGLIHGLLTMIDAFLDQTAVQLCMLLILLGGVAWHGGAAAWQAWKRRSVAFRLFLVAGSMAAVAQGFEELVELRSAGLARAYYVRLFIVEEMLEMLFSVGLLIAVLMVLRETNRRSSAHDTAAEPARDPS